MEIDVYVPSPAPHPSFEARHRSSRRRRVDRPDFRPGNLVWWQRGLYEVESVELHGEQWIAVLVRPGSKGEPEVQCWFAPTLQLRAEPGA